MYDGQRSNLPDKSNWRFDEIAYCERNRAAALEIAGPASSLAEVIRHSLIAATETKGVRFGWEQADAEKDDCRAVIQFGIDSESFDWFFNGRAGYRAHFRSHPECGLKFNCMLIEMVRADLDACLSDIILCRLLNSQFEDIGAIPIERHLLVKSLVPDLSKIWFCTKRIKESGGTEILPLGIGGPRIQLGDGSSWVAPYREKEFAWLDIKGAFLGFGGPYQPKNPRTRAELLRTTGEA